MLSVLLSFALQAQDNIQVDGVGLEEKLNKLRSAKDDIQLRALNDTFKKYLEIELRKPAALKYPFNELKSIGKITSDDKYVRVFSWNTQLTNESNIYSALVLKYDKRKKKSTVTELKKDEWGPRPDMDGIITADNWYGCVYYDIIDCKKGSKTYYTLLGYDQKNGLTHVKLLDVLYFTGSTPKLGYNLFKTDKGIKKRILMEHAKKATMTLRFDEMRNKIVYDHLSPESKNLAEFREYWVPDMSYDGMTYTNGKWVIEEDIIAINDERGDKLEVQTFDMKEGKIVTKEIKNKWETPEGGSTPVDGGGHTAVVPDDYVDENGKKNKKTKEKKVKKEKDPGFSGVSYTNPGKKKKRKRN